MENLRKLSADMRQEARRGDVVQLEIGGANTHNYAVITVDDDNDGGDGILQAFRRSFRADEAV